MRLQMLLPKVEPKVIGNPSKCAYEECGSKQVQLHQPVKKALRVLPLSVVDNSAFSPNESVK